ncbi:MAG: Aminoalkylphosphonate N-acetyltransferase [Pseudomonas citronellolis]|nr:MAG: Aminoalkylphosphonate N-acetyltransferase [Pseudomonas citronellolis]
MGGGVDISEVRIEQATHADAVLLRGVNRLLGYLSSRASALDEAGLQALLTAPGLELWVARQGEGGPVLGMLSLVSFRIPTGLRTWIEDVVVVPEARGQQVGDRLVQVAIERSRALGARTLDLTSNPTRLAAHRLYLRNGFALRETGVYRYAG